MRYLTKPDITKIFKLLCGAIPNAKFTNDTVKAWMVMFGHVDRIKLLQCVKSYILRIEIETTGVFGVEYKGGGIYFPTASEINAELKKHQRKYPHWQPPHDQQDERCLWFMALNGINDPGDLTEAQVDTIYEVDHDDIIVVPEVP